jgi:exodeoxyribonuclease-5
MTSPNRLCILVARSSSVAIARKYFYEYLRPENVSVWEPPQVMQLERWLVQMANQALEFDQVPFPENLNRILQKREEQLVWEEILREDFKDFKNFLQILPLVRTVQETHSLWQIHLQSAAPGYKINRSWEKFTAWQTAFMQRCLETGWWTEAKLVFQCLRWIKEGSIPISEEFWFAGFQQGKDLLIHELKQSLQFRNCTFQNWRIDLTKPTKPMTRCFSDQESELRIAIDWLAEIRKNRPTAKLALLIPRLSQLQKSVRRLLDEQLIPSFAWRTDFSQDVYQLVAGQPLLELKAFQHLNHWWELLQLFSNSSSPKFPLELLSHLLRLSFCKSKDTKESLIQLELALRDKESLVVSYNLLKYLTEKTGCPHFLELLDSLKELIANTAKKQLPSEWTNFLRKVHQRLGWHPGMEWDEERELFQDLSQLDDILGPVRLNGILQQARRQLQQRMHYPPQSDASEKIMVLDTQDLLDIPVDALWISGLTENQFPLQSKGSNLLPVALQTHLGLNPMSFEQSEEKSQNLLRRWEHQATELVLSCSLSFDGRQVHPSPWLNWPKKIEKTLDSRKLDPLWQAFANSQIYLEKISDPSGFPIPVGTVVRGGTSVLKAQALCPRMAYAEYRLGAKHPTIPQAGLSPVQRGNLVHWSLENFWNQAHRWSALKDITQVQEWLTNSIEVTLDRFDKYYPELLKTNSRRLEAQRLKVLLLDWLDLEKRRIPFIVEASEEKGELSLGGLRFRVRIDRLDRLEHSNQLILLDYKSGTSNSSTSWFQHRITEPQLPLYAINLAKGSLAAVAFAQVHNRECSFKGIQAEDGSLPGIRFFDKHQKRKELPADYDWSALIEDWQIHLETVAYEFSQGSARLSYGIEAPSSAKLVDQVFAFSGARGFCRVYESSNTKFNASSSSENNEV